ncbi:hypothetical protein ID866_12627 [Astraeus odoratus]|nr:hypothetical protein ID866_12627 [Astraeus odoratus]
MVRINQHVHGYHRAREAIFQLNPEYRIKQKYQEIQPEDLAVSKEVTEENRFGQGSSKLAWFWMMGGGYNDEHTESTSSWMNEFYRINWLKPRQGKIDGKKNYH